MEIIVFRINVLTAQNDNYIELAKMFKDCKLVDKTVAGSTIVYVFSKEEEIIEIDNDPENNG